VTEVCAFHELWTDFVVCIVCVGYSLTFIPFPDEEACCAGLRVCNLDVVAVHQDFGFKKKPSNSSEQLPLRTTIGSARNRRLYSRTLLEPSRSLGLRFVPVLFPSVPSLKVRPPFEATSESDLICECFPDSFLDWCPLVVHYIVTFGSHLDVMACSFMANDRQ
jgi:hypothetical protein